VIHPEDSQYTGFNGDWTIGDYPKAPPPDTRPRKVATARMLWRHDGSLAAAPGKTYLEEDEDKLITHDDWIESQS
jgi:hypothetical protein